MLGYFYAFTTGSLQDDGLSFDYTELAANNGNKEAMYTLGYKYSVGQGVRQDSCKAFYWYNKAAGLGNLQAMAEVGLCYYFGEGVAIDYDKAFSYLDKVRELDSEGLVLQNIADILASCYEDGKGTAVNTDMAGKLYALSLNDD